MTAIVCTALLLVLFTGAVLPTFAIKYTYETKYVDVPVSNTVALVVCIFLVGSKVTPCWFSSKNLLMYVIL
jgi:hypothetical protein